LLSSLSAAVGAAPLSSEHLAQRGRVDRENSGKKASKLGWRRASAKVTSNGHLLPPPSLSSLLLNASRPPGRNGTRRGSPSQYALGLYPSSPIETYWCTCRSTSELLQRFSLFVKLTPLSPSFQRLVPFYTSSYFSSDSPLRTMFFDHTKPKPSSTADELPPPRVLEFPLLKTLSLPSLDLASPVIMELLRMSPLLEHLFLTHEPTTANVGTSAIIEFPRLPKLLSLKLGSIPSSDEDERGSDNLMHVVESLRGSTSLETLTVARATSVDGTRLRAIVWNFPNLTCLCLLSLNWDWQCSMVRIEIHVQFFHVRLNADLFSSGFVLETK